MTNSNADGISECLSLVANVFATPSVRRSSSRNQILGYLLRRDRLTHELVCQ